MMVTEINGDILDAPINYFIGHCISGDFTLGAGLAKVLEEKYDIRYQLYLNNEIPHKQRFNPKHIGTAIKTGRIYNLVTKGNLWDTPTYENLENALNDLRCKMEKAGEKDLVLPHLGAGHDKMEWPRVKEIIHRVFDDSNINVEIYNNKEGKEYDN